MVDDDSPDLTWQHAAGLAITHPAVSVVRRQGRSKATLRVYREYLAHLWQLRRADRRSG